MEQALGPKGIGGWLLLYVIGQGVGLTLILISLLFGLLSPSSQITLIPLAGTTAIAFFFTITRSKKAPLWNKILLWLALILGVIDATHVIANSIGTLIWLRYWYVSKRVKNTF